MKIPDIKQMVDTAKQTEFAILNIPGGTPSEMKEIKQKLKGGKADKLTPLDISKKFKKSKKEILDRLKKGTEHELEHTDDKSKAKEIAMDHISEDPDYYEKLKKAGIDEKWSKKYKDSIDCKNPKGFSQKAHCQGKNKKSENKEATGSGSAGGFDSPLFGSKPIKKETKEATSAGASVGSYETPSMWAKSTSKKDWRGASKTQIPGGKFVQVRKKCKKFPYCNQGDINALKLFENHLLKKVINNISQKNRISEETIKKVLLDYLNNKGTL